MDELETPNQKRRQHACQCTEVVRAMQTATGAAMQVLSWGCSCGAFQAVAMASHGRVRTHRRMPAPAALVSMQLGGGRQVVVRLLAKTEPHCLWLQLAAPALATRPHQCAALPEALAVPLVAASQAVGHLPAHSEARAENQWRNLGGCSR